MFDFGIFTLPALAASAVMLLAVFTGDDIVIDKINVSHQLEWSGHNSVTVTRQLTDELREVNVSASSEFTGVYLDGSAMEKSISAFEEYFELGLVVNGTRNLFGLIKYYVNGEVTESRGEATFTARIFTKDEEQPVRVVTVKGNPDNLAPMLHDAAVEIIEAINPYVAALYHRKSETAAGQYEYPKTRAVLGRFLKSRPVTEHYLAYALLGRMHMLRAEKDTALTPEGRTEEYDKAFDFLHASLRQQPDFLFPIINLGIIHDRRGEVDLADSYFAHAVRVSPNYLLTRKLWGAALAAQNRYREAAFQYVAAVELAPEDAALRDRLAQLYLTLGRPDAARDQWLRAVTLDPTNEALRARLNSVHTNARATAAAPGAS